MKVANTEIYPWASLQEVGDYFIVVEKDSGKTASFMKQTVWIRNRYCKQRGQNLRYAAFATSYGCVVFLAEVDGQVPDYDFAMSTGIYGIMREPTGSAGRHVEAVSPKPPPPRPLTTYEKTQRMSREQREANLPWWYENGKLFWNANPNVVKRPQDLDNFLKRTFPFGPNDPYPEEYELDENLFRKTREQVDAEFEEEEARLEESWQEEYEDSETDSEGEGE